MSNDDGSALEEALELVRGSRQDSYGEPTICCRRVGQIWGLMLDREPIEAATVALMMVALKLGREINAHRRDNIVDMAGYLEIADMANARR